MKLTIEHLSPYLPYGLKIYEPVQELELVMDLSTTYNTKNIGLPFLFFGGSYRIEYGLPILRPLYDLTKEINHNGEKFVPEKWIGDFIKKENNYSNYDTSWIRSLQYKNDISKWSYWLHIKLFEWHFDVFGLIEKGLAIDINTLEP